MHSTLFSFFAFFLFYMLLSSQKKNITVLGKESAIYAITQPDGTSGLFLNKGEPFNVSRHCSAD